jgi:hypothetical protein
MCMVLTVSLEEEEPSHPIVRLEHTLLEELRLVRIALQAFIMFKQLNQHVLIVQQVTFLPQGRLNVRHVL